MGDSNMPHEVLRRFEALEARVDTLEGANKEQTDETDEEVEDI